MLTDSTNLKNLVNVKGNETFTQNGSTVTWNAGGNDIYYQGTVEKQLPVDIKITYTLDGKAVKADEIRGKSGKLVIRLDYTNNAKSTATVNGKQKNMYVPFFVLRQMVEERREAIRQSMPDVLDLLCVSVQAGLGFDGAMGKVTAKMKGPLIEEFERLLQELRMGITRRNALNRLAKRCGIEEMKLFTAALIQAEKLGVGTAQVLEIQSENMREMRRQRAKETAAKLPVNIIFPTTVFIFPALFIVVLGPAIVTIMKTFSK